MHLAGLTPPAVLSQANMITHRASFITTFFEAKYMVKLNNLYIHVVKFLKEAVAARK